MSKLSNSDSSLTKVRFQKILFTDTQIIITRAGVADVRSIDLNLYTAQCIASVLKKFLRELPDPVIPVQWYDKFLEASSEYTLYS